MPVIDVYNMEGKTCGTIDLNEKIFGAPVNVPVMHSVVRAYLLNQRQGTQSTLTRSEVAGGGDRRAPAAPDRVRPVRRSGRKAVSRLAPSPGATGFP